MATGTYNAKSIPTRQVIVDTLETFDARSGETRTYGIEILETDEELNALLHELWPAYFSESSAQ